MMRAWIGLLLWVLPIAPPVLLEKGDQEFARLRYPQAEVFYVSALNSSADSADALWRLARVYVCRADVAPQEQKLALYREAEAFARRCIEADSTKSEGHTWRAAALGNIAMFEGSKTKVRLCHLIKKELDTGIMLNPGDDIAYSILGSFYMALGNVSWIERQLAAVFLGSLPEGGFEESERALKEAIVIAPNVIRHHFELGVLYMQLDRNPDAIEEFQLVGSLPILLASDRQRQLSAAGLIKEITDEPR